VIDRQRSQRGAQAAGGRALPAHRPAGALEAGWPALPVVRAGLSHARDETMRHIDARDAAPGTDAVEAALRARDAAPQPVRIGLRTASTAHPPA